MYHVKQQRYKDMWVPIIKMENQRGVESTLRKVVWELLQEWGEVDLCWNHTKVTLENSRDPMMRQGHHHLKPL